MLSRGWVLGLTLPRSSTIFPAWVGPAWNPHSMEQFARDLCIFVSWNVVVQGGLVLCYISLVDCHNGFLRLDAIFVWSHGILILPRPLLNNLLLVSL